MATLADYVKNLREEMDKLDGKQVHLTVDQLSDKQVRREEVRVRDDRDTDLLVKVIREEMGKLGDKQSRRDVGARDDGDLDRFVKVADERFTRSVREAMDKLGTKVGERDDRNIEHFTRSVREEIGRLGTKQGHREGRRDLDRLVKIVDERLGESIRREGDF